MAMKQYIDNNYSPIGSQQRFDELRDLRASISPQFVRTRAKELIDDAVLSEVDKLLKRAIEQDLDVSITVSDYIRGILLFRMRAELQMIESAAQTMRQALERSTTRADK